MIQAYNEGKVEEARELYSKIVDGKTEKGLYGLFQQAEKAFSEGRVRVEEGKVLSATGEVIAGQDLTHEINEAVKGGHSALHLL